MRVGTLPRRHPVASLATVAFLLAFVSTAAYYAGLVPLIPRTLPTFVDLLVVTGLLLAVALATWVVSLSRS
ncbi:hypothetical protein [Halorubrum sp. F4]|uniref:hypothetical protein n=1 Tax=Halorubrum sp. F4 TaxID=2989715 RepID=UPI00247FE22F|nr:hypothetical protein [Halorubrum sp. F4]